MTDRKSGVRNPDDSADRADLPEGLRRARKSATPAPQTWADMSRSEHPSPPPGRQGQRDEGITRDQRGQDQPKDKRTARRA